MLYHVVQHPARRRSDKPTAHGVSWAYSSTVSDSAKISATCVCSIPPSLPRTVSFLALFYGNWGGGVWVLEHPKISGKNLISIIKGPTVVFSGDGFYGVENVAKLISAGLGP